MTKETIYFQDALIKRILGKTGENINIEAPFHCDYGYNIEVGENFFANYNLIVLDVGKVRIGNNAQIAPNVAIYTAGHPVHPDSRNSGYEYGIDITIGDNVWISGNTCIMPGVTIGNKLEKNSAFIENWLFRCSIDTEGFPGAVPCLRTN